MSLKKAVLDALNNPNPSLVLGLKAIEIMKQEMDPEDMREMYEEGRVITTDKGHRRIKEYIYGKEVQSR